MACDNNNNCHAQQQQPEKEWVLATPPRLTRVAYQILERAKCIAMPWQLLGRYGSRIHNVVENNENNNNNGYDRRKAIPVLSDQILLSKIKEGDTELQDLLQMTDNEMKVELIYKDYHISKRARDIPPFDARVHPERAPKQQQSLTIKKVNPPITTTNTFTYMELFAGIGGFGIALDALGGECIFCSEINDKCRRIYTANIKSVAMKSTIIHGDIYKVSDSSLPNAVDMLVGGFPCQPFSAMGEQHGLQCPKQGNLFFEIIRVLNISKPKCFILENVPGLLQMESVTNIIFNSLQNAGYTISYEIIDARCLTATTRKRLYIVGLRNDIIAEKQDPFQFPYIPDLKLRAGDVINYSEYHEDINVQKLQINDIQLERLLREPYYRPSNMAWSNCIINTLVSHYGRSVIRGHNQLVPTHTNPRKFTHTECSRIMGFPTNFILLPSSNHNDKDDEITLLDYYSMFGNAVCPPIIAAIAGAVLDRIFTKDDTSNNNNSQEEEWVAWGRQTAIRLAYSTTLTRNLDE